MGLAVVPASPANAFGQIITRRHKIIAGYDTIAQRTVDGGVAPVTSGCQV